MQSLGHGTVFVRSDSLVPGDTVIVRHYAHCRSISPCSWFMTRGIVEGALASDPRLVTVTVPVVVHAELSDYAEVGDEVRKASK